MKALCWCGKHKVRAERVADPKILNGRDAIVKISSTAICGSDLHLYDGYVPTMHHGDVIGHEFMGEVVEVGAEVGNLKAGDRVVVPASIACGRCYYCTHGQLSMCDNSNPNSWMVEQLYGFSSAGLFGLSHLFGGYAGGQAQYARVPFADVGPVKIENDLPDEQVLFLSDIFPTGYQAAENCGIKGGEVVAVWGCGPVGQFAIQSAYMLGARMVVAIDDVLERLRMAESKGKAVTINMADEHVFERLRELTGGSGPDACIDAVGMEAHGLTVDAWYDRLKAALYMSTDRPHALRQAINCCKKGGVVSIAGVYGGVLDKLPIGAAFGKGLTFRMGQTHVQRYMRPLLKRIEEKRIDPSFVVTHTMSLEQGPQAYRMFRKRSDGCVKVVLKPWGEN